MVTVWSRAGEVYCAESWDGTPEAAVSLATWVGSLGGITSLVGDPLVEVESLHVWSSEDEYGSLWREAEVGNYVVHKNHEGQFEVLTKDQMTTDFERVS